MTDQGDGIWSATIEGLVSGSTRPYSFVNGGQDNWDDEEVIEGECNVDEGDGATREIIVGENDMSLPLVAFGSCDANSLSSVQDFESIYTNAANNAIMICCQDVIFSVKIVDMFGNIISNYSIRIENSTTIDVSNVVNGIYILEITKQNSIDFQRIMILR